MKGIILSITLLFSMMVAGQAAAAKPPRPSPPTGVTATDGTYPDYVRVTWNQVAGAGIYRVHRCSIISDDCKPISYQTGSSYNDTNGEKSTVYNYRVLACAQFNNCSILSEADEGHRGFIVTAGQSGSWYDPSHSGEEFFLQVLSDTQAAVYWFTYDTNGNQLWMTGVGEIKGSKIKFPALVSPKGGKFGPDFDPSEVSNPIWGSLNFEFSDCNSAVVRYDGPKGFGDGKLEVVRLTGLWGLGCGGEYSPNVSAGIGFLNAGFSGSWYDIDHAGEGFAIEILNETTANVMWFTFDTQGNPAWIAAFGQIDGTTILVDDFQITSGAIFGSDFNPEDVVSEQWGAAAFNFTSCGNNGPAGSMRYITSPEFGSEGGQFLYRLTAIAGVECDLLTDAFNVSGTMNVAENIFVDSDVNDPNAPEISNDLDAQPQILKAPAKVVGFVTALPTGVNGDRFSAVSDEWDVFQIPLQNGETVILSVSDWDSGDPLANDIDLYLVKADDPETIVSSENATQKEWVSAPAAGVYFVVVHAFSGTSNYSLKSGQSAPLGSSRLSSSAAMAQGELIAAIRPQYNLTSVSDQKSHNSRIERVEKESALTRIKESAGGEVLYAVDTSRVDRLVPHPLTVKGWGVITPENWQVIRVAKELSVNSDYRWSGPNYIMQGSAAPNDTYYGLQWHYPIINLPQAWNVTTGSSGVVVAVIDSGVYDHPDLVSNVDYSFGYDFVSSVLNSGDGNGIDPDARDPGELFPKFEPYVSHGTHVAGTIGANSNNGNGVVGVNWDVTIMPVRVLGIDGSGSCWEVAQGMKWAGRLTNDSGRLPARTADVINMSLSFDIICGGQQEIIDRLTSNGIVVIAAAGNESTLTPKYPAALTNVISVSATTIADELAWYSNYGSTIDIAAPGGDGYSKEILSTVMVVEQGSSARKASFEAISGTSMAAPHVAGVAALMKSVYPTMGSNEFLTAISSGAITKDLANNGLTNKDDQFGYGRIDAQKAVNWALEQDGQPLPPYLTSSISSANFGYVQQSIEFVVSKGGSGDISITGSEVTETWMQLIAVNTDNDGLGTYRIDVDRTGLIDGAYSGLTAIYASDGSELLIPVAMQVGEKVVGEAGYQYALLLDRWTLSNVSQWGGLAIDKQYPIAFSEIPPGGYFLIVGSDVDNDFTICDEGEFCQIYPLISKPSEIIVYDSDIDLGLFTMGFPENLGGSSVTSSVGETETQTESPGVSNIKGVISRSGVQRRR